MFDSNNMTTQLKNESCNANECEKTSTTRQSTNHSNPLTTRLDRTTLRFETFKVFTLF